ncbi:NAD(P)/FAD-dependent oxidoreductase [Pseudonocardia eucalypti]|uniref:NAD(P)/FAD-dependent oxidoreductase n=1 Tax=Pseudonocardia eucalypti TaxID=648755 RepID=A0ABP9Q6U0_9PSEU|nr:cation diffusion facilitator CzcD-associated flavoprotein CzcO [Pseudonocardia eucalypti]
MSQRVPSVAIIGAGMSGLCMAIKLREAGITDVTVYEKADEVGGTWRDNTYPGLSCDVASRFYQFTFARNPGWTHRYSPGSEIQAYFRAVTEKYRLREIIRFGTEVTEARLEPDGRWWLRTGDGIERTVDFLIGATGILHHPRYPDIKGLDTFGGPVFHSARWDHGVPLAGKRVAVIGTGSTGLQIVGALAAEVGRLVLFQRTAQWIVRLDNPRYGRLTRALHRRFPALDLLTYHFHRKRLDFLISGALTHPGWRRTLLEWLCRRNLNTVRDPELRRKLTPDYRAGCKRLVGSSEFYPAIQRPNAELVTERISHVEPGAVVTEDGRRHELDVLALATGFDAHAFVRPIRMTGRDGITLEQAWADGPRAHQTVAMPGFPNFFMLMGPHSPVGNYSLTALAEAQALHILGWIRRWQAGELESVEPLQRATDAFNASMREALPDTVWSTGCNSWYLGRDGVPELWPWSAERYRALLKEAPNPADYQLTR